MAAATLDADVEMEGSTENISSVEESYQQESKAEQESPRDDFEDTELDSDVENMMDGEEDVDKLEEEMMNMPKLQEVLSELNSMKGERRVVVSELNYADIVSDTFQSLIHDDSCQEMKFQFVRSKNKAMNWSGFLVMNFATTSAAEEAIESMKSINPDLTIKTKNETFAAGQAMEQWARTEKEAKHWTDHMLYIKNVSPTVTKEQLEELFPSADDIVLRPNKSKVKKDDETREAYALYRTSELTQQAACEYAEKVIELDGYQLKIYKYHTPAMKPLRGYLHLTERRVVLKYMDRLMAATEAGRDDSSFIVPEWCEKRLTSCKKLIEQDDKARSIAGLSAPSLADLREIPGVKVARGQERRDLLMRLGVIDRPRSTNHTNRKRKAADGNNSYSSKGSILGAAPSLFSLNPVKPAIPSLLGAAPWHGSIGRTGSSNASSYNSSSFKPQNLSGYAGSSNQSYAGGSTMLRMDSSGQYHDSSTFSGSAGYESSTFSGSGSGNPVRSLLGGNTVSRSTNQRGRGGATKPVSLLSL